MTSHVHPDALQRSRARIACVALIVALFVPAAASADDGFPGFYRTSRLALPDGRALLGGGMRDAGNNYSYAVARLNGDGTPDLTFNGTGIVSVPVRGYYEFVGGFAVQPDGRIVAGGDAADPAARGDDTCYPAFCRFNPSLIRLNADGTLDRSFNGSGRIIIAIGDTNEGEVQEPGDFSRLALQPDGRIVLYGHKGSRDVATARLNADGTLDTSFEGAGPLAREVAFHEPASVAYFQGMWLSAPPRSPAGWGLHLAQQGDVIFAAWFTFNDNGEPLWLVMSADKTADATYAGTLFQTHGPALGTTPFDASLVAATPVGSGTLAFGGPDAGTFTFSAFGIAGSMPIRKYAVGPEPTCLFGGQQDPALATNYQDLWWAAPAGSEAGWGLGLTHQGDSIVALWLTYDRKGAPLWMVSQAEKTAPMTYRGRLYRASGPSFGQVPFDWSAIDQEYVGALALRFVDGNDAFLDFDSNVDDVTVSKRITRQVFRAPGTQCH